MRYSKEYQAGYAQGNSGEPWRDGDSTNAEFLQGYDDGAADLQGSGDMPGICLMTL